MEDKPFSFNRVDSFSALDLNKQTLATYDAFRREALRAGRFSVFEATENQKIASMFTTLCRDPSVETDNSRGYPWIIVREKSA